MQLPKDVTPPKTMVIDGVTIYIQIITSDEAKANGVMGWDAVLADSKRYKPDVAERKIADFWASWRHCHIMARRFKKPTHSNTTPDPSAEAVGSVTNPLPGPSVEAEGSIQTNRNDTPNVDAAKRKRTGTPGSAEPPPKKTSSLADTLAYSRAAGSVSAPKTKKPSHTLWVHTHNVEKGPIDKEIFFEIVSRCKAIKVKGAIKGEAEFSWNNDLKGQPTYDNDHSRGKIVCGNLQTVDFWCKYIPIAALEVSNTPCKAWTWEEYEIPKIRYSFLIPFDTCNGVEAKDLIQTTLVNNNLSMNDVLTCRTSYAKLSHQRICNIEVTDQLSTAIDDAGRFLQGPVCSLTFKLQSGNTGDPELEPVCIEIDQPMDDYQLLESDSAVGSVREGDTSSQFLNSSTDTVVPPNSPTNSVRSSTSSTSLSSQVKHLVVTPAGDPPT